MRAKKHIAVCSACRAPKRSRYRALVDDYLCDECHNGVLAKQVAQVATGPVPSEAVQAVVPDHADLAQFDLSHLEAR